MQNVSFFLFGVYCPQMLRTLAATASAPRILVLAMACTALTALTRAYRQDHRRGGQQRVVERRTTSLKPATTSAPIVTGLIASRSSSRPPRAFERRRRLHAHDLLTLRVT